MIMPDYKKITQALNYIAGKEGGEINYMKALKLLYLADRLHLRKYGRLITDDRLVAMENGTLGSQAKDIALKKESLSHEAYEYSEGRLKRDLDKYTIGKKYDGKESLSETDIECIDNVFSVFGNKDKYYLAELTHKLPEWKRYEYPIMKGEKKVVSVKREDLFEPTANQELNAIYSQSNEELDMARSLFSESLEQEKYLT